MRDGNVPRFFCVEKRSGRTQLVGSLLAQLATQLSSSQLFQLFMILLAREGDWKRGQEEGEGGEGGGKLFVKQIKIKTARSRAALYYITVPQFALPFQRPEGSH